MRLAYMWMIYVIVAAVPLAYLLNVMIRKKREARVKLWGESAHVDLLCANHQLSRQYWKMRLFMWACFVLLLCLSRPQWGSKEVQAQRKGVDIMVALDVSSSMMAEDVQPFRLEKAKRELTFLLDELQGDRVGLVVFAGTAFVQCPLTTDKGMARMMLSIVDTDSVPIQGTDLAGAIELSRKSFVQDEHQHKVLILITDGEDHEGEVLAQAKLAAGEGVIIYTVGVGQLAGAPIPLVDGKGNVMGYKKDSAGNTVVSKVNENILQKIAAETHGLYIHALNESWNLKEVYHKIMAMDKKELEDQQVTVYNDHYQWLLILAMLLLALEWLVYERRGRFFLNVFLICGLFSLTGFEWPWHASSREGEKAYMQNDFDQAQVHYQKALQNKPDDARLLYNLGNVFYKKQNWDEAQKYYQYADRNGSATALQTTYNEGNVAFQKKDYQGALAYYKKALDVDPSDEDSKYNIEYIQHLLDKAAQQQQNQSSEQSPDSSQDQQQQQSQCSQGSGQQQQNQQGQGQDQSQQQAQDNKDQKDQQSQSAKDQGNKQQGEGEQQEQQGADENKDKSNKPDENQKQKSDSAKKEAASGDNNQDNDQKDQQKQYGDQKQQDQKQQDDAPKSAEQAEKNQQQSEAQGQKSFNTTGSGQDAGRPSDEARAEAMSETAANQQGQEGYGDPEKKDVSQGEAARFLNQISENKYLIRKVQDVQRTPGRIRKKEKDW